MADIYTLAQDIIVVLTMAVIWIIIQIFTIFVMVFYTEAAQHTKIGKIFYKSILII